MHAPALARHSASLPPSPRGFRFNWPHRAAARRDQHRHRGGALDRRLAAVLASAADRPAATASRSRTASTRPSPWDEAAADPAARGRGGDRHVHRHRAHDPRQGLFAGATSSSHAVDVRLQRVRGLRQRPVRQPLLLRQVPRDRKRPPRCTRPRPSGICCRSRRSRPSSSSCRRRSSRISCSTRSRRCNTSPRPTRSEANRLLGHLIDYLRAALPHLRASSTTLRKEVGLAEAYLNILRMRMGARLDFTIDVPDELAMHPFPPNLLISLVENAIKHGIEPAASGGTRHRARAPRRQDRCSSPSRTPAAASAVRAAPGRASGSPTCASAWPRCTARRAHSRSERGVRAGARATLAIPLRSRHRRARRRRRDASRARKATRPDADRDPRRRRAAAARAAARAARRSVARARDRRRSGQRRGSAGALRAARARRDVPRHPDAREVGARRRARARGPLPRRVRHGIRRIRGRRVRGRRGRLRAEARDGRTHREGRRAAAPRASARRLPISPRCSRASPRATGRTLKWIRASLGNVDEAHRRSTTCSISRPRTSTRRSSPPTATR